MAESNSIKPDTTVQPPCPLCKGQKHLGAYQDAYTPHMEHIPCPICMPDIPPPEDSILFPD